MRRALLLAALVLAPLPLGTAEAQAQAFPPCPSSGHAHRNLTDEHQLVLAHGACTSPRSGHAHAGGGLVTRDGNVSASWTHARHGERSGAHGATETLALSLFRANLTVAYATFRDAAGFTTCGVSSSMLLPTGWLNATRPLPVCVPQEALQP